MTKIINKTIDGKTLKDNAELASAVYNDKWKEMSTDTNGNSTMKIVNLFDKSRIDKQAQLKQPDITLSDGSKYKIILTTPNINPKGNGFNAMLVEKLNPDNTSTGKFVLAVRRTDSLNDIVVIDKIAYSHDYNLQYPSAQEFLNNSLSYISEHQGISIDEAKQ